jgi:hypothetical protein
VDQEEAEADSAAAVAVAADLEEASMMDQEKCIKQFAQNVSKNVKFRSSLQKVSQFIVEIVFKNINQLDSK